MEVLAEKEVAQIFFFFYVCCGCFRRIYGLNADLKLVL